MPRYVYKAFYPDGWDARQKTDIAAFLDPKGVSACWLDLSDSDVAGFVGLRLHPEDKMGEVYILTVDPALQQQGVGRPPETARIFLRHALRNLNALSHMSPGHAMTPITRATGCLGQKPSPCIPPRENRKARFEYDTDLHKTPTIVERVFNRLKGWRQPSPRTFRCAETFLAAAHIAEPSFGSHETAP